MAAGLDYSSGPISPAAILAAGYATAFRYIDDPAESFGTKHICPDEYAALTAGGVDVQLVFEVKATDFIGGFLEGVINATRAQAGAAWVGYSGLVWFTVDTHLTAAQIPIALDYLQGCEHVAGQVGVYGFPELIQAAQASGVGAAYWQCGEHPAANSGVHVWQRNDGEVNVGGVQCDVDLILLPFPSVEDDMAQVPQDQWNAVYTQLCGLFAAWDGGTTGDPNNLQYDLLQYLLRANVQLTQLTNEVATIKQTVDALPVAASVGPSNLSDQDVQRVAAAVMTALVGKLSGAAGV